MEGKPGEPTQSPLSPFAQSVLDWLADPRTPDAAKADMLQRLPRMAYADGVPAEATLRGPEDWLPLLPENAVATAMAFENCRVEWSPAFLVEWIGRASHAAGLNRLRLEAPRNDSASRDDAASVRQVLTGKATDVYRAAMERALALAGNLRRLGMRPPPIPSDPDPVVGLRRVADWCHVCGQAQAEPPPPMDRAAHAEGIGGGEPTDDHAALPPALKKTDRQVLLALSTFDVAVLASAEAVAAAMDRAERLSERTITPAIARLEQLGYAERPEGERQGARLTNKGLRLASKLASKIAD